MTTQVCDAPRYTHDHDCCIFLGRHGDADLYFCQQTIFPTVIARYSDNPEDYVSGLQFGKAGMHPDLAVAYKMAQERGLL